MPAEPSARRPRYIEQAHAEFALRAIVAEKSRRSLAWFARYSWHVLESSELEWTPFLQAQCDTLQAFFEGWLVANDTEKKRAAREKDPEASSRWDAMVARADAHWRVHDLARRIGELLVQDLLINGWPGSLKSRFAMVVGPAWVWLHDPTFTIAATSGTGSNVTRDSNTMKELVKGAWYRETFGIAWDVGVNRSGEVVDSTELWSNSAGGYRLSKELFSSWQGVHVDYLAIDDPDDEVKVYGEADRKRTRAKVLAIQDRVRHPTRSIRLLVQQHVHAEDCSAHIIGKGLWSPDNRALPAVLRLPIEFRPARRITTPWGWTDPRTKVGEVAHPERHGPAFIEAKRLVCGSAMFEAKYNQAPETTEGGDIKRGWFRFCRIEGDEAPWRRSERWRDRRFGERPEGCRAREADPAVVIKRKKDGSLDVDWLVLSVDCKGGSLAATSSNVGLVVIAGKGFQRFVLDDQSRILGWLDTLEAIRAMVRQWRPGRVLIEEKAQGPAVLESMKKEIAEANLLDEDGKPIKAIFEGVEGGSATFISRFRGMLPDVEAGLLLVLDGAPWAEDYVGEMSVCPNGHRDDRVDSTSQCLNHYATRGIELEKLKAMTAAMRKLTGARPP